MFELVKFVVYYGSSIVRTNERGVDLTECKIGVTIASPRNCEY
jgi:hypothetical protein